MTVIICPGVVFRVQFFNPDEFRGLLGVLSLFGCLLSVVRIGLVIVVFLG